MDKLDRENFEKQYIENVKEKMKLFIQKGLLKPIEEYQTINNWTQQFSANPLVPYFLLDTLIVLTRDQVEAALKNVIEHIKSSLYASNITLSDAELFSLFEDHIKHSAFISACTPGQTAGGAPETLRTFRKVIGDSFKEIAVTDICKSINDGTIKNIYIVDDFIGTGKTMCKFMNSTHLCENCVLGKDCNVCSPICARKNNPDVNFTIISVVLHKTGASRITKEIPGVELITSFSVDDSYDLLSKDCELYRDPEYINDTIHFILKTMKEHDMDKNPYALHLPIVISNAFPNNSLELFWWTNSPNWVPLAPRNH